MSDIFNNYTNFHWQRRTEILPSILERTNGHIIQGPFSGMKILPKWNWGDGDTPGKLLGLYENELFPIIEKEIAKNPQCVINVGCAEGYYGLGMARALPNSTIVCIDIDSKSVDIARENARTNNINNVQFLTDSTIDVLNEYVDKNSSTFIIMDIEGAERSMLDPDKLHLKNVSILVEVHGKELETILYDRFKNTHNIEIIKQGAKNPHIDIIQDFNDYDKLILCCEGRFGGTMSWFYISPL